MPAFHLQHTAFILMLSLCSFSAFAQEPEIKEIDDTTAAYLINGVEKRVMFKTTAGKTLTLKEKAALEKKYPDIGFTIRKGNPIVIIYTMPEDEIVQFDKPVFNFSMTDIAGNIYTNENLKGKIVVLNFWFTTCLPCIKEMPELNELVEKYKKKNVVFLAIAKDKEDAVKKFLEKTPFNYNQVVSPALCEQFSITGYPTSIVINKNGVVKYVKKGVEFNIEKRKSIKQVFEKLSKEIDALL
jgi:peroxiredoxin